MAYRNLSAEMARNNMNRDALHKTLVDQGYEISYQTLCRQLRGETEIPFKQASLMSKIFGCEINYLMEQTEV